MRIDNKEQQCIWRIVVAILQMGNVDFEADGHGFAAINPKSLHLECPAHLFVVSADGKLLILNDTKAGRFTILSTFFRRVIS